MRSGTSADAAAGVLAVKSHSSPLPSSPLPPTPPPPTPHCLSPEHKHFQYLAAASCQSFEQQCCPLPWPPFPPLTSPLPSPPLPSHLTIGIVNILQQPHAQHFSSGAVPSQHHPQRVARACEQRESIPREGHGILTTRCYSLCSHENTFLTYLGRACGQRECPEKGAHGKLIKQSQSVHGHDT